MNKVQISSADHPAVGLKGNFRQNSDFDTYIHYTENKRLGGRRVGIPVFKVFTVSYMLNVSEMHR